MNYSFVAIEGCIGAGKTTLVKKLSEDIGCASMFENFEKNPYLNTFYEKAKKNAFPLELYFMAERFQQQKEIHTELNLFNHSIISDYAFFKSLLFASINLTEDELYLYKNLYYIIQANVKTPELIIYLHKPIEMLLKNIYNRGREYEKNISPAYLHKLNQNYLNYLSKQNSSKVVFVESSKLDFINKNEDYLYIKKLLNKEYQKKINYE